MKGFLIFLAFAFPVVLASPTFWTLVAMEWGASPVTYHYHDGTIQHALLGPKSPWPEWAILPDDARLTVRAWYGETPTNPGSGFGDLGIRGKPLDAVAAYAAKLRDAGWRTETSLFQAALPEVPPRRLVTCIVRATREGDDRRVLQVSFELEPGPGSGAFHWATRPMPGWAMPKGETC